MPRQNAATVVDRSKQLMGAHASAYANGQETYGQARRGINKAARSANNTPGFEKPGINQVRTNTKDAIKGIRQQGQ
jgi:hypothetical protein